MEKEICRRETTRKVTTVFKYLAYGCLAFAALCLTVTFFDIVIGNNWEYFFRFDTSYVIPILIAIASALLAAFFFGIDGKISDVAMSLVLTNKRIYSQFATSKIKQIESYNLNAITYYSCHQTVTKGKTNLTLIFKTSTNTAKFTVDEEFYNAFLDAVNIA